MTTRQFTGDTIDDVLTQVRGELGDDAVIIETRNIVRGGIAGFFGRAAIEVTAADRMPPPEGGGARLDILDTGAPRSGPAGAADPDEFLRRLGEHLSTSATPGGPRETDALAPPVERAVVDDRERARAIIEAARAAVREAAADMAPPESEPPEPAGMAPAGGEAGTPAAAGGVLSGPHRPVPTRADVRAVRDELVRRGVDGHRLDGLLDGFSRSALPFLEPGACLRAAVRDYIASRMPVVRDWRPWRVGHTIALVGQSGVGKTACALKIAGAHRAAGLDVALIAAGPGPHGALVDGARRLELTAVDAHDASAVADARARLASRDLVIIDTPGCSHTSADGIAAVAALLAPAGADEVHLVLPAATPAGDLGDLRTAFTPLSVNRVTLTKLDETRQVGGVLNAPMRIGRPLAYLADGTALQSAIAPADPRRVAELLLP